MFETYNKVQKAVLESTLNLIIDKELQATSMSLIAKDSGVSTGSIYHYFSSKEDIINELFRAIVRFNGEFVTKNIDEADPIQTQFRKAWRSVIEFNHTYPKGSRFIEQYSFSPYIYEESKRATYEEGWCGPLKDLYKRAIEDGVFVNMEPLMMVQMHYGAIVYLLKGYQQNMLELTDDVADQAVLACWNGVSLEKGWKQ